MKGKKKTESELTKEVEALRTRLARLQKRDRGHIQHPERTGTPPRYHDLEKRLERLKPNDHLCLIYESPEEWHAAILPFLTIGLRRGEKCIYILGNHTASQIRSYLAKAGMDVVDAETSGQLLILHKTDAYTQEGLFDPERMISLLITESEKAIAEGYPSLRFTEEASVKLRGYLSLEKLLEYEAKLNRDFFSRYPCAAICQYDRWKSDPGMIKNAIMTHPLIVRNNQIHQNFYYVSPEEFLMQKREAREVQDWLSSIEQEREAEKRVHFLSDVLERSSQPFTVSYSDGYVMLCNPAFSALTGYTEEELHTMTWALHLTPPEWRESDRKALEEVRRTRNPQRYEKEILRKDGSQIPIEVFIHQISDGRGEIQYYYTFITDITERKRAEEMLWHSEERFRSLFQDSPISLWEEDFSDVKRYVDSLRYLGIKDLRAYFENNPEVVAKCAALVKIIDVNNISLALFGASDKKELLLGLDRIFVERSYDAFRDELNAIAEGKHSCETEITAQTLAGDKKLLAMKWSVAPGHEQTFSKILVSIIDITDQKRTEKTLRLFSQSVDSSIDGIAMGSVEGKITYVNEAFVRMFGYSREELIGKEIAFIYPENEISKLKDALKASMEGSWTGELVGKRKNGELFPMAISSSRVVDDEGKVIALMANHKDITERKRIERVLIRKERVARERAQLLTDLRGLNRIDEILTRVCETVRDSGLFERAVMTLHKSGGDITYLGQVGLNPKVVERARKAPPMNDRLRSRITNKKFRISDSFFIPAEAGLDFKKVGRYIRQKKRKSHGDWQPGDELFVPLRDFSGKVMGYLSVDTPTDGCRPDVKTIEALEMLVEAAASRVREVEAQKILKHERNFSQSILETANSLIVCLDADARITVFNEECERITGYRREEVIGKSWPKLFLPGHRHAKIKSFAKWVHAHPSDRYEGSIVTKSGEIRTILWSNSAIFGAREEDMIAIAIGQDITERKQAEETLKESEEKFRDLANLLPQTIFQIDLEANLTFANKAGFQAFGYTQEDVNKGLNVLQLFVPEDRDRIQENMRRIASGVESAGNEYTAMRKDGSKFPVVIYSAPIACGKKPVGFRGVITDITERKRIERVLIRKERVARERAQLLTDLRGLNRIDEILTRVCETVRDSGLFERAVMTLHKSGGDITYLGQVGLNPKVVECARKAPPMDDKLRTRITNKKFRISDSFFIPAEAGMDFKKVGRYIRQKKRKSHGDWQPGDELFVPLRDFSGKVMGYLSVDTPADGCRPDVKTIEALEMLVEAAASRVREVEAQKALSESETRMRLYLESAEDVIVVQDSEGKYLYYNGPSVYGVSPDQIVGKSPSDIHEPAVAKRIIEGVKRVAESERGLSLERQVVWKDETLWFNDQLSPIRDADGNVKSVLTICRNITERKQMQEILKNSEQRFRSVVESARDTIVSIDDHGNVVLWNKAAEALFGYSAEEIVGKPLVSVMPERFRRAHQEGVKRWLSRRRSSKIGKAIEIVGLRKDGSEFPAEMTLSSWKTKDGIFFAGIIRGITKIKQTKDAQQK